MTFWVWVVTNFYIEDGSTSTLRNGADTVSGK
jgi:hypothetical protein